MLNEVTISQVITLPRRRLFKEESRVWKCVFGDENIMWLFSKFTTSSVTFY